MPLSPHHNIKVISLKDFKALLAAYKDTVPTKLAELEDQRLSTIPTALGERGRPAYLTKNEVQTLVDWKLSHGTFRPSLTKLVASNSEASVQESTKAAFALYNDAKDDNDDDSGGSSSSGAWDASVGRLAKDLRGIGPATASLLLSVFDSERVPFFSDELFRWAMFEGDGGKGKEWDRKIKYSIGEYRQLVPLVQGLRERMEAEEGEKVTALEAEMVAYVLGRGDGHEEGPEVVGGQKRTADDSEDADIKETASDKQPAAQTDRSSRKKRK